jgi:hypothetical protein
MEVARSGYYAWYKNRKSSRQKKNESLSPLCERFIRSHEKHTEPDEWQKR